MTGRFKAAALIISLSALGALILLQRLELKRTGTETSDLRRQLGEMAAAQERQEQLIRQLKAATAAPRTDQDELLRLRGQSSLMRQLEQENSNLKAQFRTLDEVVREAQREMPAPPRPAGAIPGGIPSDVHTTDLGMIEIVDRTPAQFELGGGTNCVLTPTRQPDGTFTMVLRTEIAQTDGPPTAIAKAFLKAHPGQPCAVLVGDRMIAVAVTFK